MYPANQDGNPTPLMSLDDLSFEGAAADKPMKVFVGHNLGFRTFTMSVPMHEFFSMSEVANDPARDADAISQRKLDPTHAYKLALYILKGLVSSAIARRQIDKREVPQAFYDAQDRLGRQPYLTLQPIVVNIRECNAGGASLRGLRMVDGNTGETASFKVFLSQQHVLWVVDGQHRRHAMQMVFDFLEGVRTRQQYPKKGSLYPAVGPEVSDREKPLWDECFSVARGFCTIAVEVHLGLTVDQERQLFHDLNRLSKKVETSLALHFDSSNPVNLFIKERLIEQMGLKVEEKDQADWHNDSGSLSRKDIVAVNALLFLNKTNIGSATPIDVKPRVENAYRFWQSVSMIPGFGEAQAREKTVAAQPVVLKALAKLVFDFAFSNRRTADSEALLQTLLDGITDIDFSHANPMWRYFELTEEERTREGLATMAPYMPDADANVNRDIGKFQGGFMRFGAKHNDIYPIIGDMIRWRLGLPNRHARKTDPTTA